jgi:phosphatidate cytidylyltransferase
MARARADVSAREADGRWRDLRVRAASALILGPLALACVWLGDQAYLAMVALAATVLAVEWVHLCGLRAAALPGLAVPVAVVIGGAAAARSHPGAGLVLLALGCVLAWVASRAGEESPPARRAPVSLAAGVAYVGVSAVALIWLRAGGGADGGDGRLDVLFVFLVVWTTDILAYAGGRLLGGPRLAPLISPGKTWSGALTGLAAAIVAGVAFGWATDGAPGMTALIAAALSCVAQAGDLAESLMKRRFGVKDAGRIIPGHGGLLDRMDGVLAAAPVAALLALALGRGLIL